jgi:hypothetical protein
MLLTATQIVVPQFMQSGQQWQKDNISVAARALSALPCSESLMHLCMPNNSWRLLATLIQENKK